MVNCMAQIIFLVQLMSLHLFYTKQMMKKRATMWLITESEYFFGS